MSRRSTASATCCISTPAPGRPASSAERRHHRRRSRRKPDAHRGSVTACNWPAMGPATCPADGAGDTIPPGATITYTGSLIATPFRPRSPTESDREYVFRINSPFYEAFTTFSTLAPRIVTTRVIVNTAGPGPDHPEVGVPRRGTRDSRCPIPFSSRTSASPTPGRSASSTRSTATTSPPRSPRHRRWRRARPGPRPSTPPARRPGARPLHRSGERDLAGPQRQRLRPDLEQLHDEPRGRAPGGLPDARHLDGARRAQILGTSVTLTATALDSLGHPVAGLPVQLVIAGSNAQTVPLVTGADGTASFTYDGPNLGADTATVTATINGPTLTATRADHHLVDRRSGRPARGGRRRST